MDGSVLLYIFLMCLSFRVCVRVLQAFPSSFRYIDSQEKPEMEPGSWFLEVALVPHSSSLSLPRTSALSNLGATLCCAAYVYLSTPNWFLL